MTLALGRPARPDLSGRAVVRDAVLTPDRVYRYELVRLWDVTLPVLHWLLLNPSTADADRDDPTVRRVCGFSGLLGFGGAVVHNLCALRSTHPDVLLAHPDPIGPRNDLWLSNPIGRGFTIAAWGTPPRGLGGRVAEVRDLFATLGHDLWHLGLTAAGHPRHPVRLPYDAGLKALDKLEAV